jgi:hypothetical protein
MSEQCVAMQSRPEALKTVRTTVFRFCVMARLHQKLLEFFVLYNIGHGYFFGNCPSYFETPEKLAIPLHDFCADSDRRPDCQNEKSGNRPN